MINMVKQIEEAEKIFNDWLKLHNENSREEEAIQKSGTSLGAIYSALSTRHRCNGNQAYFDLDDTVKYGELDKITALRMQIFLAEGRDSVLGSTIWLSKVEGLYRQLYELTEDEEISSLLNSNFKEYINELSADHKKRYPPSAAEMIWQRCAGGGRDPDIMHDLYAPKD